MRYLLLVIVLLFSLSGHVFATPPLAVKSMYLPSTSSIGYKIGIMTGINSNETGILIFDIPKNSLNKYIDGDSVFFKKGTTYSLDWQTNLGSYNYLNMYWGLNLGLIMLQGYQFDEIHPLLFVKLGAEYVKEIFGGNFVIGSSLNIGFETYMKTPLDIFFAFNPRFVYEMPIYIGYRFSF